MTIPDILATHLDSRVQIITRATRRAGQPDEPDPDRPQCIYYPGEQQPWGRRYAGTTRTARAVHRVVCVSNTALGAATLASTVCTLIDAHPAVSGLYTVTWASDPIEDRDDPTAWCWSSTVEITEYITR